MLNPTLDMEDIRLSVCAIALAHPYVAMALRNESTGKKLVQTKKSESPEIFAKLFGSEWIEKLVPLSGERKACEKIKQSIAISGKFDSFNFKNLLFSNIFVLLLLFHTSLGVFFFSFL